MGTANEYLRFYAPLKMPALPQKNFANKFIDSTETYAYSTIIISGTRKVATKEANFVCKVASLKTFKNSFNEGFFWVFFGIIYGNLVFWELKDFRT